MEKLRGTYGKYAINTSTEKEFKNFLKILENDGLDWSFGEKPTKNTTYWSDYKEKNCFNLSETENSIDGFCSIDWYLNEGYTILSAKRFLEESGLRVAKKMTKDEIEEALGYNIDITDFEY